MASIPPISTILFVLILIHPERITARPETSLEGEKIVDVAQEKSDDSAKTFVLNLPGGESGKFTYLFNIKHSFSGKYPFHKVPDRKHSRRYL